MSGRATSLAFFAKATEAAQSARLLFDRGSLAGASDRAFFAMFNASRALLAIRGLNAAKIKSHAKVRALFAHEFVQPGDLPAEMALALHRAEKVRQTSDFGAHSVDPTLVQESIDAMAQFMSRARNLIKTKEEEVT